MYKFIGIFCFFGLTSVAQCQVFPVHSPDPVERFIGVTTLQSHTAGMPNASMLYHSSKSITAYLRFVEKAQGTQLQRDQVLARLRLLHKDSVEFPILWYNKRQEYGFFTVGDVEFIFNGIARQIAAPTNDATKRVYEIEMNARSIFDTQRMGGMLPYMSNQRPNKLTQQKKVNEKTPSKKTSKTK